VGQGGGGAGGGGGRGGKTGGGGGRKGGSGEAGVEWCGGRGGGVGGRGTGGGASGLAGLRMREFELVVVVWTAAAALVAVLLGIHHGYLNGGCLSNYGLGKIEEIVRVLGSVRGTIKGGRQ